MFITAQEYLQRITTTLEHMVAPQIECEHMRGQVLAAVFLLDQLMDRIEYKPDLIRQEIEKACETTQSVVAALVERGAFPPDELKDFLSQVEQGAYEPNLEFRNRCNAMLSLAIDFFYACRNMLDPSVDYKIEGLLLDHLSNIAFRDMGMLKFSTSLKLLQKKGQPELR